MLQDNFTLTVKNGQAIRGKFSTAGTSGRAVIMVHGFGSTMHGPGGIFETLEKKLIADDISSFRFNFRGVPPSDGYHREMALQDKCDDLIAVYEDVLSKGFQNISIVCESFGAVVVLKSMEKIMKLMNPKSLIFWYPAFDLKESFMNRLNTDINKQELEKKGYFSVRGFRTEMGKALFYDVVELNVYDELSYLSFPCSFMHGEQDRWVYCEQSIHAFNFCGGNATLHFLSNADHFFLEEPDYITDITKADIKRYL